MTGFISSVRLMTDRAASKTEYPFSIPAVAAIGKELRLNPKATFFVGENGSGKSTLMEAIAVAAGFNPEGGSRNFNFGTRASHSELHGALRLVRRGKRPRTGFFLRAESYFNLATNIEDLDRESGGGIIDYYGGRSLHEQSHGESLPGAVAASLRLTRPVPPRRTRSSLVAAETRPIRDRSAVKSDRLIAKLVVVDPLHDRSCCAHQNARTPQMIRNDPEHSTVSQHHHVRHIPVRRINEARNQSPVFVEYRG